MNMLKIALGAVTLSACLVSGPTQAQTREEFRVMSAFDYEIAGDLALPDEESGLVPVVVLISGSGAQDRDAAILENRYSAHRHWREVFTEAGVAVLSFDETGTGESGGEWAEMGLYEHADNVARLISWVRNRREIDPDSVYVLGHSEGSMIASMLASEDESLAGLIHISGPGRALREVLEYQLRIEASESAESESEIEAAYEALSERWMSYFDTVASLREGLEIDPLSLAGQTRSPALVVQGWTDWQVEPEQAMALASAINSAGQPVDLHILANVNHLLVNDPEHLTDYEGLVDLNVDDTLSEIVVNWVVSHNQTDD